MTRVLLYGGTTEGHELACALAEAGLEVCVSVATDEGAKVLPKGLAGLTVRIGAQNSEEKHELMTSGFDVVVDATHPYATSVSKSVREAAQRAGLPLLRIIRPKGDTEGCVLASSIADAVGKIPPKGNVLATTGSKEIGLYAAMEGVGERLYARVLNVESSVEACRAAGIPDEHIIAKRGPFSVEENIECIDEHRIEVLVTKDGGNAGGYPEKLEAARARGVTMIVIERPEEETGIEKDEALQMILEGRFSL
ncbi:MAG: precorrin-6A reductase [Coriobacteriales bacterium]|nr:precorrin-6A reductase [Coriobacteriales bacterium]